MSLTQVHLDEATLIRLDAIASSQECSREDLLREAVRNYLEFIELKIAVEKGRADIARGAVYSAEEVESYFSRKRDALRVEESK